MKKLMLSILVSLISVFCFTKKNIICFATDNLLEAKVKYLTAAEAASYNTNEHLHKDNNTVIAEGDYAVTLYISNNTGFATGGFQIKINPSLVTPLMFTKNNEDYPVYVTEDVLEPSARNRFPALCGYTDQTLRRNLQ